MVVTTVTVSEEGAAVRPPFTAYGIEYAATVYRRLASSSAVALTFSSRRRMIQAARTPIAKANSTPPTTPPAIAPVLDFFAGDIAETVEEEDVEIASEDDGKTEEDGVKGVYLWGRTILLVGCKYDIHS